MPALAWLCPGLGPPEARHISVCVWGCSCVCVGCFVVSVFVVLVLVLVDLFVWLLLCVFDFGVEFCGFVWFGVSCGVVFVFLCPSCFSNIHRPLVTIYVSSSGHSSPIQQTFENLRSCLSTGPEYKKRFSSLFHRDGDLM